MKLHQLKTKRYVQIRPKHRYLQECLNIEFQSRNTEINGKLIFLYNQVGIDGTQSITDDVALVQEGSASTDETVQEKPPHEEIAQNTDTESEDDQLVQPRRFTKQRRAPIRFRSGNFDMTKICTDTTSIRLGKEGAMHYFTVRQRDFRRIAV
ncbi:GLCE [Mytilus edulis]|uniref:GLCE n=1 Tax=Mytilus edulis TaxID=6550 RepID=A0A8S3TLV2_MYTED|nr:GLCE [Mytilus edulis]